MRKFWIVMSDNGASNFPFRHLAERSAVNEAERLANLHGGKFFVMEATHITEKQTVITRRLEDEMPF